MYKIVLPTGELIAKVTNKIHAFRLGKKFGNCWVLSPTGGIIYQFDSKDRDRELISDLIDDNFVIEKGPVVISKIQRRSNVHYQVYCDTFRTKHNELYKSLDMAVNSFINLIAKTNKKNKTKMKS